MGLTVADIDSMTAGEILDLAYYRINQREEHKDTERTAKQTDYDSF